MYSMILLKYPLGINGAQLLFCRPWSKRMLPHVRGKRTSLRTVLEKTMRLNEIWWSPEPMNVAHLYSFVGFKLSQTLSLYRSDHLGPIPIKCHSSQSAKSHIWTPPKPLWSSECWRAEWSTVSSPRMPSVLEAYGRTLHGNTPKLEIIHIWWAI